MEFLHSPLMYEWCNLRLHHVLERRTVFFFLRMFTGSHHDRSIIKLINREFLCVCVTVCLNRPLWLTSETLPILSYFMLIPLSPNCLETKWESKTWCRQSSRQHVTFTPHVHSKIFASYFYEVRKRSFNFPPKPFIFSLVNSLWVWVLSGVIINRTMCKIKCSACPFIRF